MNCPNCERYRKALNKLGKQRGEMNAKATTWKSKDGIEYLQHRAEKFRRRKWHKCAEKILAWVRELKQLQDEIKGLRHAIEDRDKMHETHIQAIEAERMRLHARVQELEKDC
jgi:multidrug resistance efflux pump